MDIHHHKNNPLLKQHVIYSDRATFMRSPEIYASRCIISISDTEGELHAIQRLLIPLSCECILFVFQDVEDGEKDAFTEDDAKKIIHFVNNNRHANFLVHCFLGASRSAAVAKFIVDYLGLDDSDTANLKHYNKHVYNVLSSITSRE